MNEFSGLDPASLIKARLALVRRDLHDVLVRLSQESMDWAPKEGMRTISGQLVEILATELQTITNLKEGKRVSDDEVRSWLGNYGSIEVLRDALDTVRSQTLEYLDSLSPEQLAENVKIRFPWFVSSDLPDVPRSEVFVSIAQHEWYHVGQLVTYLWARGDDPYSW